MAKGVKSIKQQYVVGSGVYLIIDTWLDGTTEAQKNGNITWLCFAQNKKDLLDKRVIGAKDSYTIKIPPKLAGSYTYYVEASLFGSKDSKRDRGLSVFGTATKKIVSSKWCTKADSEDVRKAYTFSYGHIIYLGLETEGLNGDKLIVDVYKRKQGGGGVSDDQHIATYANVEVIDGEVNLKIGNTYEWYTKIGKPKATEEFYIKAKTASGKYVTDGKDAIHARFLRIKNTIVSKAVESPTNNTPTKVGKPEINFKKYEPCKYDKIALHDKDSNKDAFDFVIYDPVKEKNINKYETLAKSNEAKSTIDITFEKIANKGCFTETHKKEIETYINGKKQKTEILQGDKYTLPIQAEANKILLLAKPELFFITPDSPRIYKIVTKTCAQPNNPFYIHVYPNVEREVAFVLSGLGIKGFNAKTNIKDVKNKDGVIINRIGKRDVLTGYSGEKGMKLIDGQLEILYHKKGSLGFGLQAKVKVDNTVSSIELGKTKKQISELIGFYHTIVDETKDFNGKGRETTSLAYRKGSYPKATFDIEPPNVAFALRMTNKKIEKTANIVTEYSGGLALKPITGIKIGVDLISLIPYFGLQGRVASKILEFCTEQANIEIYIIFELSFQARAEFNLAYNEIEGLKAGKQKLELEALATGKIGIKSREKSTLTIVTSDGSTDKAKGEFKGEGGIAAGLLYTYEVKGDKKGMFSQHILEFTGLKASIIIFAIDERMKYNTYFKRDFTLIEKPEKPWYTSDKEYI